MHLSQTRTSCSLMKITVKPCVVNCCLLDKRKKKKNNSVRYRNSIWDNLAGCLGSLWCTQDSVTMTDNLGNNWARPFVYLHLPLHLCHVFHLGIRFRLGKVKMIFNSKKKFTGFFMNSFLVFPPPTSPALPPSCLPSFQLGRVSSECQMQND